MKTLSLFLWMHTFMSFAQNGTYGLILGNIEPLCLPDSQLVTMPSLPNSLSKYHTIFLFSNATSLLHKTDIIRIERFLKEGGGLYNGSDNWPLQAEANQITKEFYQKESFGNYNASLARSGATGNLKLSELDTIPAGITTAAFPMDYRLKVDAWIQDQPLILSGNFDDGRIVIDTGYSRFYCNQRNSHSDALFQKIYTFLRNEKTEQTKIEITRINSPED